MLQPIQQFILTISSYLLHNNENFHFPQPSYIIVEYEILMIIDV
jgi:hypothetical protein